MGFVFCQTITIPALDDSGSWACPTSNMQQGRGCRNRPLKTGSEAKPVCRQPADCVTKQKGGCGAQLPLSPGWSDLSPPSCRRHTHVKFPAVSPSCCRGWVVRRTHESTVVAQISLSGQGQEFSNQGQEVQLSRGEATSIFLPIGSIRI